jgi:hypothetical protein
LVRISEGISEEVLGIKMLKQLVIYIIYNIIYILSFNLVVMSGLFFSLLTLWVAAQPRLQHPTGSLPVEAPVELRSEPAKASERVGATPGVTGQS